MYPKQTLESNEKKLQCECEPNGKFQGSDPDKEVPKHIEGMLVFCRG